MSYYKISFMKFKKIKVLIKIKNYCINDGEIRTSGMSR